MPIHKYPNFVDKDNIHIHDDNINRYLLKIPFSNFANNRHLCIILKNPSYATTKVSDKTINNVLKYAFQKGYGSICILNLFPYRSTDPSGVSAFYSSPSFSSVMAQNFMTIFNECYGNDVVFAWGTNTISKSKANQLIYDSTILAVSNIVSTCAQKTYFVDSCKSDSVDTYCKSCSSMCLIRYPLHGLRWNASSKMIAY